MKKTAAWKTALRSVPLSLLALSATCHTANGAADGANGRITAQPRPDIRTTASGHKTIGLGGARDAVLQVPPNATGPLPLLVLLHGAGGAGENMLRRLGSAPDDAGIEVLAPDSR